MKPLVLILALLTVLVAVTGCSKSTYPVAGRVVLADGTPVANAFLVFESVDQKISSKAMTDDTGKFILSTHHDGDGAYLGEYRALIIPPWTSPQLYDEESGEMLEDEDEVEQDDHEKEENSKHLFDPKYTRFETSGLNFTVEKRGNDLQIVLNQT
ncbi:MAG: hypothetical protein ACI9G1_006036 [Pirellulaceae bacterium]|jgi:hypothetical protein